MALAMAALVAAACAGTRRAWTRRAGPGLGPGSRAASRAAEIGRGDRGPWRGGHPRGCRPARGPRLGLDIGSGAGHGRRRYRRQPALGLRPGFCRRRAASVRYRFGGTVRPVGHDRGGLRRGGRDGAGGNARVGTVAARAGSPVSPACLTLTRACLTLTRACLTRARAVARLRGRSRSLSLMACLRTLIRGPGGKRLLEPPHHGRLDRRGSRSYELAHLLELVHHGLALDSELLREFVNPDLRHYAPSRPSPLDPLPDPGPGRACSGSASAYGDHRRVLIERSSASRPAFRQVIPVCCLQRAAQPGCSALSNAMPGTARRKDTQPARPG